MCRLVVEVTTFSSLTATKARLVMYKGQKTQNHQHLFNTYYKKNVLGKQSVRRGGGYVRQIAKKLGVLRNISKDGLI